MEALASHAWSSSLIWHDVPLKFHLERISCILATFDTRGTGAAYSSEVFCFCFCCMANFISLFLTRRTAQQVLGFTRTWPGIYAIWLCYQVRIVVHRAEYAEVTVPTLRMLTAGDCHLNTAWTACFRLFRSPNGNVACRFV